jgi:GNAT superfamily N-acetyltransferase
VIRRAMPGDAAAIARVQGRAWRRAFADIVDPEKLVSMSEEATEPAWRATIEEGGHVWVFDQDGTIAGFGGHGPSRDADATPGTGELYVLYVDPPAQGAGVGTRLVERIVDELRQGGYADAVVWTFAANELGRRFYEGAGWSVDGEAVRRAHDEAPVVRYRRKL